MMKKVYLSTLFLAMAVMAMAQTQVTFRVDMTGVAVDASGLHAAGSFQNWNPADDAWKMTDSGNGVYTLTQPVAAGDYEFKFVNGNAWQLNGAEVSEQSITAECGSGGVGTLNRVISVPDQPNYLMPVYLWDSCTESTFNSTKEIKNADLNVTPNPFTTKALISFENTTAAKFTVTVANTMGQVLRTFNTTSNAVEMDRASLQSGIYFVVISNEKGETASKRFVIQ